MASSSETSSDPGSGPSSRRKLPASIWALGFVSLLMDVSSEMIHALLPVFMVTVLSASALTVGLVEGAGEGVALIVKFFSGALSDYWARRKPLAVLGYALGALSKPLFALAGSSSMVLGARLMDRTGKGIRGAPRDALVADIVDAGSRGAAYGLRQALDTAGAFLGPLLAMGLMLLWMDDFRKVFWVAVIPGVLAVVVLIAGVREPPSDPSHAPHNPLTRSNLRRLPASYWWIVGIGGVFTLARFSEAFLLLRAQQGGLAIALTPLVFIAMNLIYGLSAYPIGKLSDRSDRITLLAYGLLALILADLVLAYSGDWTWVWLGVSFWGLHMGITQGLLNALIADNTPAPLRGTAFGVFNLVSGVAVLVASVVAGLLWDVFGPRVTFTTGALFSGLALMALLYKRNRL